MGVGGGGGASGCEFVVGCGDGREAADRMTALAAVAAVLRALLKYDLMSLLPPPSLIPVMRMRHTK